MSRYKNQPPNFGIWALGYCVNDQRRVRLTMQGTQPTATTPLGPSVSIVSSLHHGVIFLLLSSPGGAAHLAWSPLCSGEDATSRGRVTRGQVPGRVSRTRHTRQPVPARVHTWHRDRGGGGREGATGYGHDGIVWRKKITAPWKIFQSCEDDPSKSKKTFNVTNYNQRRCPFSKENIHCWCFGCDIAVKFKIQILSFRG